MESVQYGHTSEIVEAETQKCAQALQRDFTLCLKKIGPLRLIRHSPVHDIY